MRSGKTYKKLLLVLIAFAVGWYSLYTIINFHQYRIFGKELTYSNNPSFCKREDDIVLTPVKQKDNNELHQSVKLETLYLSSTCFDTSVIFQIYSTRLNFISGARCRLINCNIWNRLRGPPVVS